MSESTNEENAKDVALMLRVKEGDVRAFEELVTRHQGAVIGTVAKMLNCQSEAEDIAQQVFLRLWKSAKRYKEKAKFTTYLFTITRNLVFNESKRRSTRKQVSIEQRNEETHVEIADTQTAEPNKALLEAELNAAVDAAIEALPKKQRLAMILRRYEQLPYEEIATILGTSVASVKSHLFRARATLKESLSKYLDQDQ